MNLFFFSLLQFSNLFFSNYCITINPPIKKLGLTSLIALSSFTFSPINVNSELLETKYVTQSLISNNDIVTTYNNNIYLYGDITQSTCFLLRNYLTTIETENNNNNEFNDIEPPNINLHIQSNGGTLMHAIYLMDYIHNMRTPVYTYIDGHAASAATIISIAGKKRYMTENSLMMIHQLSSGSQGKYSELEDSIENMNTLMKIVKNAYLKYTKIPEHELDDILKHDIWFDSHTCLNYGLVDEIL